MTCHNCGSAIAHTRGDLHSQHLCAACTTAYTWGYLAVEGRARAQEHTAFVRHRFQQWGARGREGGGGVVAKGRAVMARTG